MTIHLIKSAELSAEVFTAVYDLLTAVDGTITIKCDPASVIDFSQEEIFSRFYEDEEAFSKMTESPLYGMIRSDSRRSFPIYVKTVSWSTLFNKCETYRNNNSIPENEMVLMLTEVGNKYNWFATLDKSNPNNGFVNTADWDMFLSCPKQFPIAYEVIALLLHRFSFDSQRPITEQAHARAIGCVSDLCMEKKDIILKMRTADVCGECMTKLKERMPMQDIIHALGIMDSLRVKMLYAQNFKQLEELSDVCRDQRNNKIYLPGFSNIEIKLRPLEKTLYFLFMRYPNGLFLSDLPDHRDELADFYEQISHSGTRTEMRERINDLVNVLSNSASEKISRIKRAFEEAIGPDLAKHYYIQGGNGERKRVGIGVVGINVYIIFVFICI
jgi:hypothetical protein